MSLVQEPRSTRMGLYRYNVFHNVQNIDRWCKMIIDKPLDDLSSLQTQSKVVSKWMEINSDHVT